MGAVFVSFQRFVSIFFKLLSNQSFILSHHSRVHIHIFSPLSSSTLPSYARSFSVATDLGQYDPKLKKYTLDMFCCATCNPGPPPPGGNTTVSPLVSAYSALAVSDSKPKKTRKQC